MKIAEPMENFSADLRLSTRSLLKNPGFLVVVVLSLALGIAANSTIFSVLNALLYRPLPYPAPERLVVLWQTVPGHPDWRNAPPIAEQVDWSRQNNVFEDVALLSQNDTASVAGLGEPRPLHVQYVTPNLFALLRAKPILGRIFLASEAQDHAQTVVLSQEFWKRELNSDPNVLGKTIIIEGVVSTVVGVMRPHFSPFYGGRIDLWIPINPASGRYSARIDHWLMPVARLKAGVTLAQAQTGMDVVAHRLEQEYPATNKGVGVKGLPLRERRQPDAVPHGDATKRVRAARFPRRGAASLDPAVAYRKWPVGYLRRRYWRRLDLCRHSTVARVGRRCPGCVGYQRGRPRALVHASYFLGHAHPLRPGSRHSGLASQFESGLTRRRTKRNQRIEPRHALAIAEVALAMVLLVGAGLMINTMLHLRRVNPGFDYTHLMTMEMQLPEGGKSRECLAGTWKKRCRRSRRSISACWKKLADSPASSPPQ